MSFINADRLARTFTTLCEIDSPSRQEHRVAAHLRQFFSSFPTAEISEDDSAAQTGSTCGNLIIRLPGTGTALDPLFFACHMDVVSPCLGVTVQRQDNVFTSKGDTVLGGDDKAGIAILLELVHVLHERTIPHPTIELLFTTCEEIGLLGAKSLDPQLLTARHGFALDSTGVDTVIYGAPAAVAIKAAIHGRAAHAGLHPEQGVNAIFIASQIISNLPLGRLDRDSTANIGLIQGGTATNIVPELAEIKGEIRSHSEAKLSKHLFTFQEIFNATIRPFCPPARLDFHSEQEYPLMRLDDDSPVLALCRRAEEKLSRPLDYIIAGGGSDANIFSAAGLATAILGIGMNKVHSTEEYISLDDMVRAAELCLSIVTD